jgi:hypothetical protein
VSSSHNSGRSKAKAMAQPRAGEDRPFIVLTNTSNGKSGPEARKFVRSYVMRRRTRKKGGGVVQDDTGAVAEPEGTVTGTGADQRGGGSRRRARGTIEYHPPVVPPQVFPNDWIWSETPPLYRNLLGDFCMTFAEDIQPYMVDLIRISESVPPPAHAANGRGRHSTESEAFVQAAARHKTYKGKKKIKNKRQTFTSSTRHCTPKPSASPSTTPK